MGALLLRWFGLGADPPGSPPACLLLQELSGRWVVEPAPGGAGGQSTLLRYEISLQPWLTLPNTITRCGGEAAACPLLWACECPLGAKL